MKRLKIPQKLVYEKFYEHEKNLLTLICQDVDLETPTINKNQIHIYPSPAAAVKITERPTASDTLLLDTLRNFSHLLTANLTNEAIAHVLETIKYNNIRSHIVSEIRKEIAQKLKTLLENSESLVMSAKETQSFKRRITLNDLTISPNTASDSETEPKSDEQQLSHDNKQQIFSKELSENSKVNFTKSILVTDSVNVPKQDHEQQSHDDKQKKKSLKRTM